MNAIAGTSRRSLVLLAGGLAAVAVMPAAASAQAPAVQNEVRPGKSIGIFHTIDFVAAFGYELGQPLKVSVFRGPHLIGSAEGPTVETAEGPGLEVNHGPAGAPQPGDCWSGLTPDVRPGDKVVVSADGGQDTVYVDDIRISRVVEGPGGDVYAEGVARYANGTPVPVEALDSGEVRAADRSRYAPTSVERIAGTEDGFRAVYAAADNWGVVRGTGSKLSVLTGDHAMGYGHIAPPPPVFQLADGTDDVPGPALGCEGSPAAGASAMTAVDDTVVNLASGDLQVSGVVAEQVDGVQVSDGTTTIDGTVEQSTEAGGKAWTATFSRADLETLADGDLTITATFGGAAPTTATRTIKKDTVAPGAPVADPAPGTYVGSRLVTFATGDATDAVHFTRDGSQPTPASPKLVGDIRLLVGDHTIRTLVVDAAGNPGPSSTFDYKITEAPAAGAGAGGEAAGGVTPAGLLPAAPAPVTGSAATTTLRLGMLSTAARVKRSRARVAGLRLVMRLPGGTEVVRVRVFRRKGAARTLISSGFRAPAATGLYRMRLSDPKLLRAMTPGAFEIEVTPGTSRTSLGAASRSTVRVIAG